MEWIRLYIDILDDEKISKISDFSYKIFTFLLLLCRERELDGKIDMSISDIAWRFRLPENKIKKAINELLTTGILSSISPIIITKWKTRQYKSDDVTERVKRFRHKNETLHETLQNKKCNVIETETETETETEAEQKQNGNDKKTAFMNNLKTVLDKTKARYPLDRDQQAILVFVQANIRNRNPDAILHCIDSIIKAPEKIKSLPAYLNAALKIEDGKYNAMESEQRCNEFKKMDAVGFDSMINSIGHRI